MLRFVQHRVADRRILRLIQKWLKAGVMEEGIWSETEMGTPQGAVISPLLANIYLHYVFDLWVDLWRKQQAFGDVIVVRYADDTVLGFQHQVEADRFLEDLRKRLACHGEKRPDADEEIAEKSPRWVADCGLRTLDVRSLRAPVPSALRFSRFAGPANVAQTLSASPLASRTPASPTDKSSSRAVGGWAFTMSSSADKTAASQPD
jgi:Reverse transcriptase (RNA-dependent DNA polymerase)